MKNILLNSRKSISKIFLAFILVVIICISANNTFAQTRDAGGTGDGITPAQPCPVSIKRNNGQGTCGGDAQVRLSFNQLPDFAPTLVAIWYNGEKINYITTPVTGDASNLLQKGYISYCLEGGNIPPAHKLVFQFHYANAPQEDCFVSE